MEMKPEVIEYKKCPVCGVEETLIALLASKEIDKGINSNFLPYCLQEIPFVMRSPIAPVIIGSKAPAGNVFLDICKGCGIVRAISVEIGEAMAFDMPKRG